jgi:hypothetical protein
LVFISRPSFYIDGFVQGPKRAFGALQRVGHDAPKSTPPTHGSSARSGIVDPTTTLKASSKQEEGEIFPELTSLTSDMGRSSLFSLIMVLCGAALGPFLDSYHSAFGVLQYDEPIKVVLWGTEAQPGLITAWWVPELFGLAGFLIGWLYISGDEILKTDPDRRRPSPPMILLGIAFFTFQYWLSGVLYSVEIDRVSILNIMSVLAGVGFLWLDGSFAGFLTSLATAVGGPLIEVGLLLTIQGHGGYHYTDPGETGFFPLWISPIYFLGGPAVGNLARGFWTLLSKENEGSSPFDKPVIRPGCKVCGDTRCIGCPNCDAQGYYVTYGRRVKCNCCKGRGLVICRACFLEYCNAPADIEAVREVMSKMPD